MKVTFSPKVHYGTGKILDFFSLLQQIFRYDMQSGNTATRKGKRVSGNPDSSGILHPCLRCQGFVFIVLVFFIFLFVPFPTNSMFRGFTVVSWNLCLCKATKSDVVNLPDCFPNVHPVSQASKVSILSYLICISPSSSSHLTFPVLFHFINQCIL